MFLKFALFSLLVLPVQAFATFLECEIRATVVDVQEQEIQIEVLEARYIDGFQPVCGLNAGDKVTIQKTVDDSLNCVPVLKTENENISWDIGMSHMFKYRTYSGMGENGSVCSVTFELMKEGG